MIVDQEEIKRLFEYNPETGDFTWRVRTNGRCKIGAIAGTLNELGYRLLSIGGKTHYGHRMAWLYMTGSIPDGVIDHINGNPSDNRFANLRLVDDKVNQENRRAASKNSKSGFLGVHWHIRNKKWNAQIKIDGRIKWLGAFKTAEDARDAYLDAKRQLHAGCTI